MEVDPYYYLYSSCFSPDPLSQNATMHTVSYLTCISMSLWLIKMDGSAVVWFGLQLHANPSVATRWQKWRVYLNMEHKSMIPDRSMHRKMFYTYLYAFSVRIMTWSTCTCCINGIEICGGMGWSLSARLLLLLPGLRNKLSVCRYRQQSTTNMNYMTHIASL